MGVEEVVVGGWSQPLVVLVRHGSPGGEQTTETSNSWLIMDHMCFVFINPRYLGHHLISLTATVGAGSPLRSHVAEL